MKRANNRSVEPPGASLRKTYVFTYNNYSMEGECQLREWLVENTSYSTFGREVAPTTGTPHLQGYMTLNKKQRMTTLQNVFKKLDISLSLLNAKGSEHKNHDYSTKEDGNYFVHGVPTANQGKRSDLDRFANLVSTGLISWKEVATDPANYAIMARYPKWCKMMHDLYPEPRRKIVLTHPLQQWQKDVIAILVDDVEQRRIIWIWSEESKTGKSTLCRYLKDNPELINERAILNTKCIDLKRIVRLYDRQKIIWFDLTRRASHISENYSDLRNTTLEALSTGGDFHDEMYGGAEKYIDAHIVVSCNDPPPWGYLPERLVEFHVKQLI